MEDIFSRTELLIGKEGVKRLQRSHVALFGLGGVGSYAAEALARCGVGTLSLFDGDFVNPANLNRQLCALHSTLGMKKTEAVRARILDINPAARVFAHDCFYGAENADRFDLREYDYIVDAVDTVSSKLILIERAEREGIPIVSCMGAGNKLDPARFEVADIYETSVCPLAKVVRRELRKRGVAALKVVYSREEPVRQETGGPEVGQGAARRMGPGSIAFVPSVAGLILAGEAVRDLVKNGAREDEDRL